MTTWVYEWLRSHSDHFSVYGSTGPKVWAAGANTPRVLASAQKLHVLAAFLEQARVDPSLARATVPIDAVERHYVPGTDGGAHALARLTDGIAVDDTNRVLSVTSLLVHMLYHSSNAAGDAVADLLEASPAAGPRTATLPPRMSVQFRRAYPQGPRYLDQTAVIAAGKATYQGSVQYLADLMSEVVQRRYFAPTMDALRFLPKLTAGSTSGLRGKRGRLPGYRAGVLVRTEGETPMIIGAYAFDAIGLDDRDDSRIATVERSLMAAAVGRLELPGVKRRETSAGDME